MLRVGLTGGVASGKSAVAPAARRARRGGARRRPRRGGALPARRARAPRPWPRCSAPACSTPTAPSTAAALAALVLADADGAPAPRGGDPPAGARRARALARPRSRRASQPPAVAVVEAALLVETGPWRDYHRLVVVTAPVATLRRARAGAGAGAAGTADAGVDGERERGADSRERRPREPRPPTTSSATTATSRAAPLPPSCWCRASRAAAGSLLDEGRGAPDARDAEASDASPHVAATRPSAGAADQSSRSAVGIRQRGARSWRGCGRPGD